MSWEVITTLILIISLLIFLIGVKLYYSFKCEIIGKFTVILGTIGIIMSMIFDSIK